MERQTEKRKNIKSKFGDIKTGLSPKSGFDDIYTSSKKIR